MVNTLYLLFRFYIHSSLHVAIATCALVVCTFLEFTIPIQPKFLYFTFGITVVAYNLMKYAVFSVRYHIPESTSMKAIQVVTLGCGLMALYYLFQLPWTIVWVMLPLGILSVGYMLPVFPNKKSLRSIRYIKIFIIAIVWTGITVILPVYLNVQRPSLIDIGIVLTQRFLFIIIVMLPFEIRDLQYDALSLHTIPQRLGIPYTKRLGGLLLFIFVTLLFFRTQLHISSLIATLITVIITGIFLWRTKRIQSPYFCSFGVESIAIVWCIVFVILKIHTIK